MDLFKGSLETKGKFCEANIILCFEQVLHKANLLISFNNHLALQFYVQLCKTSWMFYTT